MNLEDQFYPSDLLPAAPVLHEYRNVWLRDLFYMGLCSDEPTRKRIWKGMIGIMDRYRWKLEIHAKQAPIHWYEFMHVRYSPEGKEINQNWLHNQFDSHANAGEVALDSNRLDLAELWLDNLATEECYHRPAAGMWEDRNTPDSYSIASCLHFMHRTLDALPRRKSFIEDQISKGRDKLDSLLPYADEYGTVCLSLLGVIWPFDLGGTKTQRILDLVVSKLKKRPFGFIRYQGDSYEGESFSRTYGNETPWILGDLFMAKIQPDNPLWMERVKKAKDHFGCIPEAYTPEDLKPNRNTPLLWGEAMYLSLI